MILRVHDNFECAGYLWVHDNSLIPMPPLHGCMIILGRSTESIKSPIFIATGVSKLLKKILPDGLMTGFPEYYNQNK